MITLDNYIEPEYRIRGTEKTIVGRTTGMLQLFHYLNRLANLPTTVLLQGETGTGKELFARALHYNGTRSTTGPFVVVNCAQIPSELLESILFGHVKGAFTGAIKDARGVFRTADRGTVLLDEIGDMSFPLQAKILRTLQEGEVQPVGAARVEKVDVRVVAATNKDLRKEVEAGRFREDLYYRLSVAPIQIPPLRERREDIPLLAEYIMNRVNLKYAAAATGFSRQALEALSQREWHGNIRELENVIERSLIFRREGKLTEDELLFDFDLPGSSPQDAGVLPISPMMLKRKEGSFHDHFIRKRAPEKAYTELLGLGDQRRNMIIYLTPDNWSFFFKDPQTEDAQALLREIEKREFNKVMETPFRFYSGSELLAHEATYASYRRLMEAAKEAQVYDLILGLGATSHALALTEATAPYFVPYGQDQDRSVEQLRTEIRTSYQRFKREFLRK
ncbi:sigma-54-dependent Fis family transcriptional regulator [Candidatus Woesearchaeota archaeon]|nr:sigma-54-dependent Fis family transcriptional regulator [Candidatus Woesearchaeota archaeon]